ncbi:MAG: hypothetical protein LBN24_00720, partial [Mediterranea sp.]|nr:hypothetical protein [Mediterranea sp.]
MCNEGKPQKMQPCITLSESLNTKVFDEKNQVHQKQFNRVIEEIEGTIKEIEESQNATTYERRQNTISIIGSRGSGKSSFVHSILNKYENSNKVAVLPMIDPTLMEQKGHIFLVIIAQIKKMVEYKLNMKDCNPESANMSERKDWRAKLEKLSQGLPTINGIGHPHEESWEDADYIMDRGISAVQAASDLEKNFTELVEYGLKILDKKAFLLALDDIDLDFQKGWPVLETLRKYITTPQIITLLSGDMELFDKAVRKMQWKNFGKALLINEGERLKRIEEYDNHVTQLSEQYLLKVIQPAHRYVLDTLWGKYQKKEYVNIRYGSNKDNKEATCYYKMVLKDEFGIKDGEEAKTYYAYLMNLPLRTQIQLLYALHKKEGKDKERISIEAIYSPFLGELSIQKIDIHLATSTPTLFNVELLRFLLLKANILGSSYQLEPSRAEESYNACLTVFSLLLSVLVKTTPFLIFDYFLKIGYVCNLASFIGYKRDKNESGLSIEGLCMHAAIYQDINLRNAAACIAAYLKAFTDRASKGKGLIEKDFYYGIIKLSGLQERARRDLTDRIDFVLKNEQDKIITLIGYMPFSIALPVNGIQTVQYSIYTLLATIGELLKIGFYSAEELSDLNEEEKGKKEKDIKEQIGKAILSLSQPRTYPMPHNKQGI